MEIVRWNNGVHREHRSHRRHDESSTSSSSDSDEDDDPEITTEVVSDANVITVEPNVTYDYEPDLNSNPQNLLLLDAVQNKDEAAVRRLLDEGGSFGAKNLDGRTLLHLAVLNDHASMIQLLFEKGADTEAADVDGFKPLHLAVKLGNVLLVELLLKLNANVESVNVKSGKTAFYTAIESGQRFMSELLLEKGADIDASLHNGYTALFCAVIGDTIPESEQLEFVNFLLSHGANKKIELEDGRTVKDFAEGDNALMELLQSNQLLEGPSITNPNANPELRFIYTPSLPADNVNKVAACNGFEATMVDFFFVYVSPFPCDVANYEHDK